MTETTEGLWQKVDLEINDFIGDGEEAYCLTDKIVDEGIRAQFNAVNLVNTIGLKRRIGKILKARGYTKTSTSPPMWVLRPAVPTCGVCRCRPCVCDVVLFETIPEWVRDHYLLLQAAIGRIEKEYPGIEAGA
jgi:hypothetical protein